MTCIMSHLKSHLKLYDRTVKCVSISLTITSPDHFDETIIHRSIDEWKSIGFNIVESRFEEHDEGECDITYFLEYECAEDFIDLAPKVNKVFQDNFADYHFIKISFEFTNNLKESHHYQIFRMPGSLEILTDLTQVADYYYGNATRQFDAHRKDEQIMMLNLNGNRVPIMWRKFVY